MEHEHKSESDTRANPYAIPAAIVIGSIIISGTWIYNPKETPREAPQTEEQTIAPLENAVLPKEGFVLPVSWGDLGARLVSVGAIDEKKFRALYEKNGAVPPELEKLLSGSSPEKIVITEDNAAYLLNLLWALGLSSKNPVLDSGEIMNPAYGGPQNFASTGGWTIASGNTMDHYSRHMFFNLTPWQQALVAKIARGVYRPCCNNSTHFPDCNHGMAMLGLLELMASQGVNEQDMWRAALSVNSFWFPDTYLTIAEYMRGKGVEWSNVDPKEILGADYSSASGFARIVSQATAGPSSGRGGSGCSVGAPVQQPRQSGGCSI